MHPARLSLTRSIIGVTSVHWPIPVTTTLPALRRLAQLTFGQRNLHGTPVQFKSDNNTIANGSNLPDRTWIDNFKRSDIPEQSYEVSFARSSGPGGQNVNKVNTKVLLRFPMDPPPGWLPAYCAQVLARTQTTKINKQGELLVSSDKYRTQRQNMDDCIDKLYDMIVEAGYIPRETSAEQRKKVAGLAKADKERRLEGKKLAGKKKTDRKVSRDF